MKLPFLRRPVIRVNGIMKRSPRETAAGTLMDTISQVSEIRKRLENDRKLPTETLRNIDHFLIELKESLDWVNSGQ